MLRRCDNGYTLAQGWAAVRLLTLALAALLLAGCASPTQETTTDDQPDPQPDSRQYSVDANATLDWWEAFVEPGKRDAYIPDSPVNFNQASRDVIADSLEAAGFEITIHAYAPGVFGVTAPTNPAVNAWTIEANFAGSDADNETLGRVGMIAHYDTQAGTIQGAYDNGSGTAAVVHTCIDLAKANLTRNLTCLLFDAEEVGTVTSGQYVDNLEGQEPFDVVLGFDMVGLNCPGHAWKQYQFLAANFADQLFPLVNQTIHGDLGMAPECTEIFMFNDRNSDESQFASAGIPTIRFAGGRTAGAYPEYHTTGDTVEFVYEYAGGRDNFAAGMDAIMRAAWHIVVAFDEQPPLS